MPQSHDNLSAANLSSERLQKLLQLLARQGYSQAQVAGKAGLPPQYLSDVKNSRRPMTELVARRLGEEFGINHQWLLGLNHSMENPKPQADAATPGSTIWLPLFNHPIDGEPRGHADWDGTAMEVAGAAAAKLALATRPYLLRFGRDDVEGRLQKHDILLISQSMNAAAEIHVVGHRKKLFLARANQDGSWMRLAGGKPLPGNCLVNGHAIAIIWSSLC